MDEKQRAEWIEQRRKCITGTDIGALVGVNHWASPMTVFLDKLGLSDPLLENEPMIWGRLLEPVIAGRYARDAGITLTDGVFIRKDPIGGGTPDYLADDKVIEIKTAGIHMAKHFGEAGTDEIPDHYMTQVQWYLYLTDLEKADLVALIAGQDYRIYHIQRNQKLIDILIVRACEFWENHVEPQIPPPMDATPGSEIFLKSFFPRSQGNIYQATPDAALIMDHLHGVRTAAAALDLRRAELENQLKYEIGTNDGLESSKYKVTWRSVKTGVKTDWERIAKECNPDTMLIDKYSANKAESRRFVFTSKTI